MADIAIELDVEFDGTGQPTGKAFYNGVKYTGVSASEVGSIPATDGKSSTKNIWVRHRAIVQDSTVSLPSGTFTIHDRATHKKITSGPWTKA